jgi:signal transduction histidine kinase
MRSIRQSLILSFLLLLVLSLVTISTVVYRTTQQSLAEKTEEIQKLLTTEYEDRCKLERDQVDDALLAEAFSLGDLVNVHVQRVDWRFVSPYPCLGLLTASPLPAGYSTYPLSLTQDFNCRVVMSVHSKPLSLRLQEMIFPENESQIAQYFQINTDNDELRSESLKDNSFPFDPKAFGEKPRVDWRFIDSELKSGVPVRRVVLKMSNFRLYFPYTPHPKYGANYKKSKSSSSPANKSKGSGPIPPRDGSPSPDSPKASRPAFITPEWTLYVHAGCESKHLADTLAGLEIRYLMRMDLVEEDAQAHLAQLRDRLLAINAITFFIALLGGCGIVYWGLSSVGRLSDAVSQISSKDFRLPLEGKRLPVELQPIADRLIQTLDLLKRAFSREKQAAADISHELRTPVAAMLTTLDVALKKPRSTEEYREILEECRFTGQQMSLLVERMLALARLDAQTDRLRPQDVDVNRIAEQCTSLVRPLANARGLTVSVESNGPARIKADPDKLREVLTNLLHNAIEYNKPDGKIWVKLHRDNGHLDLEVRDTGIGIGDDAREHIFERFFRVDSSRQADHLHAGIGLSLVKGYVDLMGGTILVDSKLGEGSSFHIRLPNQDQSDETRDHNDGSHKY